MALSTALTDAAVSACAPPAPGQAVPRRRGRRQGGDPVLAELEQEHDAEKPEHRQPEQAGGPAFPGGRARASQMSRGRMAAGSPRLPEIAFNSNGKICLLGSR